MDRSRSRSTPPPADLIGTQKRFDELCDEIAGAGVVAFDTEFVSESYYKPKLCLMQLATPQGAYLVDPLAVPDLSPWWELMADDQTTIIVHGGREEIRFCQRFAGAMPRRLIDVQVAEGLLSRGYPLAYKNIVAKVVGQTVGSHETRSDWERRPLATKQLEYAVEDVEYLLEIWRRQEQSLQKLGRIDWAYAEFDRLIDMVQLEQDREGWRKLSGVHKFSAKEQAVARALHEWRDRTAERHDRPARVMFRDDMLLELVKRQPKSVHDMNLTRGMQRRDYQSVAEEIIEVIHEALSLPADQLPQTTSNRSSGAIDDVLSKLLSLALANRCMEMNLSMSLVGTMSDIDELIRWHVLDGRRGPQPRLLAGWRADVCGDLLTDLLDGKVSLRVSNPRADAPLRFDRRAE